MARPKKKNADYFSHDSDMRNDPKVKALRRKYGIQGYALWSMILEVLTDADYFEYEWSDLNIELLAGDFDIEPDDLKEFVEYCISLKLIQKKGEMIFSEKMKERFESLLNKRNRDRQPQKKELSTSETPKKENTVTEKPQSKVKESKVKESKVKKEESNKKSYRFSPPSKNDVYDFLIDKKLHPALAKKESEKFCDFYDSKNWYVGKNKMKNWKSAASGWINRMDNFKPQRNEKSNSNAEPTINRQSAETIHSNSQGW